MTEGVFVELTEGVFVELTEVSLCISCSIRGKGAGEASSAELMLAFTHSWNCDKEDSRWFQSFVVSGLGRV